MAVLSASVLVPVSDFLHLTYRPDLHRLVGRWQRPVSATELRRGYEAAQALAEAVDCPYWQLDLRGRNAPDAATWRWITHEFWPQLAERLGTPACVGYLLTPSLLREMGAPTADNSRVAFFAEEGPLTDWLTQCQHRRRADLAQAGFRPPPAA